MIINIDLAGPNKVLIIGIDGCRSDALLAAKTPNIDNLWENGAFSFYTQTDRLANSGPCWTSILTGVWHEKHHIKQNNDLKGIEPFTPPCPHFFERIKQFDPGLVTASIVNWSPIHTILPPKYADIIQSAEPDSAVSGLAVKTLTQDNPDAIFIQFDNVDHAGHSHGYGPHSPEYIHAIETTDKWVGHLVNALKNRPSYNRENWLILLTADHGGIGTEHGETSPQEQLIFFIAHGPSVQKGEIMTPSGVVDVPVTAMAHLGVPIDFSWDLDGQIKGLQITKDKITAETK